MDTKELIASLTDEQKARAKACKTPEDYIAFAREEGIELTDEQLEAIAGGTYVDPGDSWRLY